MTPKLNVKYTREGKTLYEITTYNNETIKLKIADYKNEREAECMKMYYTYRIN